ncbi:MULTISPECIES: hypothetical protein [unclassified Nitratiruptor]|uniref:hypothetical protein n=1 Tax=unclassified Nitratiruptor TaxID=2624044 RepID=UPI001915FDB4|nr:MULTISPECIES: hypothetical protein [unclassified Nitratiruptor]BCD59709.1 hypothetical protein NitYY0810_C0461 [Nitratiruptor sp. YY08-10]BCD63633.1 hypothetical protein NitYY0814_C0461 [Nitratiruptor sp. YY08-14]
MELYIKGKVFSVKPVKKGEEVVAYQLQFLEELPEGGVNLQQIKAPAEVVKDPKNLKDKQIMAKVRANVFNGIIYYKAENIKIGG